MLPDQAILAFRDRAATEARCSATAIAALREAAALIENQVEGPASEAVLAALAKVAMKYQRRTEKIMGFLAGLGAMAENIEDRDSMMTELGDVLKRTSGGQPSGTQTETKEPGEAVPPASEAVPEGPGPAGS